VYEEALAYLEARDLGLYAARLRIRRAWGDICTDRWARSTPARWHYRAAPTAVRGQNRGTREDPLNLTARQRSLALALAQGHSNRRIAADWQRSLRTVEQHVRRLLAKLDLRSRDEVAARLAAAHGGATWCRTTGRRRRRARARCSRDR
jgi:DNA-binding CsgD family transcriptional regulator